MERSDAALKWDYSAVNKEADLRRITWSVYNKTEDDYYPLAVEYPNGTVKLNFDVPPEYDGRIKRNRGSQFWEPVLSTLTVLNALWKENKGWQKFRVPLNWLLQVQYGS